MDQKEFLRITGRDSQPVKVERWERTDKKVGTVGAFILLAGFGINALGRSIGDSDSPDHEITFGGGMLTAAGAGLLFSFGPWRDILPEEHAHAIADHYNDELLFNILLRATCPERLLEGAPEQGWDCTVALPVIADSNVLTTGTSVTGGSTRFTPLP